MTISKTPQTVAKSLIYAALALVLTFGSAGLVRADETPSSLHVVTAGVGQFQNNYAKPLRGTAKDATDMAQWFQQQQGKLSQHVEVQALVNQHATADNILNALSQLQYKTNDNSLVIFHVASHGKTPIFGEYRFCAYDRPVRWSEVLTALQGVRGRVVVFLDTCQSGGATSSGNVTVFAGCQVTQLSYEEPFTTGNGYFTKMTIKGLAGGADTDKNGIVTLGELNQYVPAWVSYTVQNKHGKAQQPVLLTSLYLPGSLGLSQMNVAAQSVPAVPSNPVTSNGPITSSGPLSGYNNSSATNPAAMQPIQSSGPLTSN